MFHVLVADKISASGLEILRNDTDIQVDEVPEITATAMRKRIATYDALIVRSRTHVSRTVLEAGRRLQVVGRAGTGVDNIDLEAATEHGILVVNAPTGNSVAAAEHTVAMLMALTRHIPQADAAMRTGQWDRALWVGNEVRDKIFGTIGLGRVATEVVNVLRELGMRILAYDPFLAPEIAAQHSVRLVDLETLLREADFISIHVPLTHANHHLLGAAQLALVKPTTRILNVARGGLVDEDALIDALVQGRLAGAALDVFESEPPDPDSALFQHPAVIMTPHLGASTVEAQDRVSHDVAVQIRDVLHGRQARYAVNAPIVPPRDLEYLVPYIDLATRMGRFLLEIESSGVKEVELTAHGPIAQIDLAYIRAGALQGLLAGILEERVNVVNADQLARQRGMHLMERKQIQHTHRYDNMLTMRLTHGDQRWTVRGAVLHGIPNIVSINDLWVEFVADGHMLLTAHMDRPGMIGRVGTILGNADVNISFMHVGRRAPRQQAIMVIGTDEAPPTHVCNAIRDLEEFNWVKSIAL